jgi:Flp pilus assembly pilin Flp
MFHEIPHRRYFCGQEWKDS